MSQGIGLDLATWEQEHGEPEGESGGLIEYNGGAFHLVPHKNTNIWYLERIWGDNDALPLDEARAIASRYIPEDATLLETTSDQSSTIDIYHSEWLIGRYPETMAWSGGFLSDTTASDANGNPGDFMVHYQSNHEDRIVSFFITTGRAGGDSQESQE